MPRSYCMTEMLLRLTVEGLGPSSDSPVYHNDFISLSFFHSFISSQRELFTHMNVWTTFMYWPEAYPQTPEDCGIQKRNATVEPEVELLDSPPILRQDVDADLNNNKRK